MSSCEDYLIFRGFGNFHKIREPHAPAMINVFRSSTQPIRIYFRILQEHGLLSKSGTELGFGTRVSLEKVYAC